HSDYDVTPQRTLSIDELRNLIGAHTPPCISIYLPTRRGRAVDDRPRYEGLVRSVHERVAGTLKPAELRELLAPFAATDDAFWNDTLDGLAMFRSRDLFATWELPATVPEL